MPLAWGNSRCYPALDASGRLIPVFETGFLNQWIPERGSRLETNTQSLYVNDRWQLNDKWAFNLGVRYEQVDSEATGDIVAAVGFKEIQTGDTICEVDQPVLLETMQFPEPVIAVAIVSRSRISPTMMTSGS